MPRVRNCFFNIVILSLIAAGQTWSAPSEPTELAVYAGAVVSDNPVYDSVAIVEFPFSVNRDQFEFYRPDSTDSHLYSRIFAQVVLLDNNGYAVDSAQTIFSVRVNSAEEAAQPGYRIFNRLALPIRPGSYSARVTVIDVASKTTGDYFLEKIIVPVIEKIRINIGGVCLAYQMKYVGDDTTQAAARLTKSGFSMLVNPVSIFSIDDTVAYVYGEIYNLSLETGGDQRYLLTLTVLDAAGDVFRSYGSRVSDKPGSTAVIKETMDISGWPVGGYTVQLIASDLATTEADTSLTAINVVSPEEILATAAYARRAVSAYDSLTVKDKVNMVSYVLTPEQKGTMSSLNDSAKVVYLNRLWSTEVIHPRSGRAVHRDEMVQWYKYCNLRFSSGEGMTDGWMTDRGRIYLTYGPWGERDEFQAPMVGNPYEVWYYHEVKEGTIFIFEDWTGNDDYRLVHSNAFGEVYSKDWQDKINQGFIEFFD